MRARPTWVLRQDFSWQCRTTGFSAYALNERPRFLDRNGWLGTIGYLGEPTQFDYHIAWGSELLTVMFLFADFTDAIHLLSWAIAPADVAQDAGVITSSPTPPTIQCTFEEWVVLRKGE